MRLNIGLDGGGRELGRDSKMTQAVRRPPLHHTLSLVLRFSFVLRLALGLALDFELELRFVLEFVLDLVKELLFVCMYVLDTLCVRLCVRATLSVRVCVRLSVRVTLCVRRMGLIMEEKQTKERKKARPAIRHAMVVPLPKPGPCSPPRPVLMTSETFLHERLGLWFEIDFPIRMTWRRVLSGELVPAAQLTPLILNDTHEP